MLGRLPDKLSIRGQPYDIRPDFRNILTIMEALSDDELSEAQKVYICLRRLYINFSDIPEELYSDAAEQAVRFIECESHRGKPTKARTVDWVKDEQLLFAAVNTVAGVEVRDVPYMHWWTFMGYFQSIDSESLYGFVLQIRQKKSKHKKLEKREREFYAANKELVDIEGGEVTSRASGLSQLDAMFAEMQEEV